MKKLSSTLTRFIPNLIYVTDSMVTELQALESFLEDNGEKEIHLSVPISDFKDSVFSFMKVSLSDDLEFVNFTKPFAYIEVLAFKEWLKEQDLNVYVIENKVSSNLTCKEVYYYLLYKLVEKASDLLVYKDNFISNEVNDVK